MPIALEQIVIQTINGIVTGMILALVASGLTLIFGIMDVVNFAHGELFMLGAYVGTTVLVTTGSFWLALLVASVTIALLGAAIQITTLRPLLGRDPLDHHPRHLRDLPRPAKLRPLAVRAGARERSRSRSPGTSTSSTSSTRITGSSSRSCRARSSAPSTCS